MIFYFQLLRIMYINFNGVDIAFECRRIVFEWEGFGLESFQNDKSLSLSLSLYIYIYISYSTLPELHALSSRDGFQFKRTPYKQIICVTQIIKAFFMKINHWQQFINVTLDGNWRQLLRENWPLKIQVYKITLAYLFKHKKLNYVHQLTMYSYMNYSS